MKKLGIALSGGGARGIVHIGILKAIDEAGIPVSMVTGTSAGAIVGAFYCSGYSPDNILEIIHETKLIKYVRPAVGKGGLLRLETLEHVFRKYLRNNSFEALKIPLAVAATDIRRGNSAYLRKGDLIRSVFASCAVPVLFKPIKLNGETYVDGGILKNLPVDPLVDHCDVIAGCNCNHVPDDYEPGNMRSLLERTLMITFNLNTYLEKDKCDIFLEPAEVGNYRASDFSKADEIFDIGYEYGKSMTPKISKLLQ